MRRSSSIDDQIANVRLLTRVLRQEGYTNFITTSDSRQALQLYKEHHPDLILLDLMMPHLDGYAVMEQLRRWILDDTYVPILVLTANITADAKRRALSLGAKDFLLKPFDAIEVLLRIENLLETRMLYQEIWSQNQVLEEKVRARTYTLEAMQQELLVCLARAAEFRDSDTHQHAQRVGDLAALIAEELGESSAWVELLRRTAPLHDLGKIGISDTILLKPGKLTDEEMVRIREHASMGAQILTGSQFALLQLAEEIACAHHERWDGTGYPQGLSGENIPLSGRIVALADAFDALTHERPYKHAWPVEQALAEIVSKSGTQFDPRMVEVFLRIQDRLSSPYA